MRAESGLNKGGYESSWCAKANAMIAGPRIYIHTPERPLRWLFPTSEIHTFSLPSKMSSIGPQLPPQLAKRKRGLEDDGAPTSLPFKAAKGANPNEIHLGAESSDDDYGPSVPNQSASAPEQSIRPAIPPGFGRNTAEIDLNGDELIGPTLGPTLSPSTSRSKRSSPTTTSNRPIGPTMPPSAASNTDEIDLGDSDSEPGPSPPPPASKRIYGPSLPPAASVQPDSDSDSDVYGPALPSATFSRLARPSRMPEVVPTEPTKRDDWMLAPPTATGYRVQDPTKLKNRTFRSGPSAASAGAQNSGVPSIWTETAQEKLARLQNSVLGRGSDEAFSSSAGAGTGVKAAEESERRRKIDKYTAQTRGKSLLEERQEARKGGKVKAGEEEDDPSKRPFDREKDMAIGGRLGAAQKRALMNKASNFGDRFQKGTYL
ncbi:hypothetical protein jhhlp_005188 [Lomentospora prolificans]|uniref:DUF3752 domain-containing protein n=1 Tax=Lomentospora prolificans TaxID=41688 RepID=A0A2N3N730_9PEZI|nr:hypothetical protein jhhlp_005188 [Lomentospora prolificans]